MPLAPLPLCAFALSPFSVVPVKCKKPRWRTSGAVKTLTNLDKIRLFLAGEQEQRGATDSGEGLRAVPSRSAYRRQLKSHSQLRINAAQKLSLTQRQFFFGFTCLDLLLPSLTASGPEPQTT